MRTAVIVREPGMKSRLGTPGSFVAIGTAVVIALLAAVGGWLAILALAGSDGHVQAPRAAAIGDHIPTSFGSLTVEGSEVLPGLTAEDLGGVTHGVKDLVLSDSAQVQVSVLLVSTSGVEANVDPAQFRLVEVGTQDPLAPTGATMRPVTLEPGAQLEASVIFVVPRTGAQMSLRYTDPGSGAEISVPIGSLDQAPPDAANPHTH